MSISRGRVDRLRGLIESMRLWWTDAPSAAWLLAVGAEVGLPPRLLLEATVASSEAALGFLGCDEPLDYDALRWCRAWADGRATVQDVERAAQVAMASATLRGRRKKRRASAPEVIAAVSQAVRTSAEVEEGAAPGKLVADLEAVFRAIVARSAAASAGLQQEAHCEDTEREVWRARIALLCDRIPCEERAHHAIRTGAAALGALTQYLDPDRAGPSHGGLAARAIRAIDATQRVGEVATMMAFYLSFGPDELCDTLDAAAARIRAVKAAAEVTHSADLAWALRPRLVARVRGRHLTEGPPVDLVEAALISGLTALRSADALMFGARTGDRVRAAIERQCAALVRRRVPFDLVFEAISGMPTFRRGRSEGFAPPKRAADAVFERLLDPPSPLRRSRAERGS